MYSGFAGQLSVQQPSEATLTFLDSEADGHVERVQVTSPDGGGPLDGGEGRVRVDDQLSCRLQHVTAALVRTHGRQTTHGTATTPQQTTHGTAHTSTDNTRHSHNSSTDNTRHSHNSSTDNTRHSHNSSTDNTRHSHNTSTDNTRHSHNS